MEAKSRIYVLHMSHIDVRDCDFEFGEKLMGLVDGIAFYGIPNVSKHVTLHGLGYPIIINI